MTIIPIILSGGTGTRLWPLSRASKPKQFLKFGSQHSLFQETLRRCSAALFDPRPIVVGADAHRFLLSADLQEIGIEADILLEPVSRNSCPAVTAGCLQALERDPNSMVLVLAADHHIPDSDAFADAVFQGSRDADLGALVTFGVKPEGPATGYGYIEPGEFWANARKVKQFVEKPNSVSAHQLVESGFLWNSGNFLFRADVFLEELEVLAPWILEPVSRAFAKRTRDLDFHRLDPAAFAKSPSDSIDCAVMEKTLKAVVLPVEFQWSDIGSWVAVGPLISAESGNAIAGDGKVVSGVGNLVHSEGKLTALLGVNDLVVITTRDAVLVSSKARVEEVKQLVALLQTENRCEATEALKMFRPWGNYERLDMDTGYQVKRIVVNPGGVLSLQKHQHRSEHWVVVQGEAEVTVDGNVTVLKPNESVYVPLGSVHRLANRGTVQVVLIEVQTGTYLGEDDIIRLEDNYNRAGGEMN